MNRRRVLHILGGTSLASLTACQSTDSNAQTKSFVAFGTRVHIQLHGVDQALYTNLTRKVTQRVAEIEAHFSLYDETSTICQLNRESQLRKAPQEFLNLLETALAFGKKTTGLFDVSMQPLWQWRTAWKNASASERTRMERETWQSTVTLVDYQNVLIEDDTVSFVHPSMAISLNGIAQGYATDQIVALLSASGITHSLVNIGEYAAIGQSANGSPWEVSLRDSGEVHQLAHGRALAVSSGSGYTFDPAGRYHHLFQPKTGENLDARTTIAIEADDATTADALSTTLSVATESERPSLLSAFPSARLISI